MKLLKSFILAFILLTATTDHALSQTVTADPGAEGPVTSVIKVKGITCAMDLKMISANVEKLKGVSSCKAGKKGATTTFVVNYHAAHVTEKDIFDAIEGTGSCDNPDMRPYRVKK